LNQKSSAKSDQSSADSNGRINKKKKPAKASEIAKTPSKVCHFSFVLYWQQ